MADTTASLTAQQAVDAHHNHLWDIVALLDTANAFADIGPATELRHG